jgi:hypothetical protein
MDEIEAHYFECSRSGTKHPANPNFHAPEYKQYNTVMNEYYTQWICVDPTSVFVDLPRWTESKRKTTAATSFSSFCRQPWTKSADDEAVCRWRLYGDELGETGLDLRLRWVARPRFEVVRALRRQTRHRTPASRPPASMPAAKHAGSRARPREMQSPARGRRRRKFPGGGWWRSSVDLSEASTFRVSATSSKI